MASESEDTQPRTPVTVWLLGIGVALLVVGLAVVAWRGCRADDPLTVAQREAEQLEKEKKLKDEEEKKKEDDPRIERLVVEPGEPAEPVQYVKPGHWMTASQRMRALYLDFIGQSRLSVTNSQGQVYPVDRTPFDPESTRPVLLLKGQPKDVDTTFFVPQVDKAMQIRTEQEERGFGRSIRPIPTPVTRMPSYQYHFVILAKEPSRYGLIKTLDSVVVPWDGETDADDTEDPVHYRVMSLAVSPTVQLPDNPLTWTSIAYILWDEVDPAAFTPEQERAPLDWLHWGGQLIVSGPDSLDLLKGSFLERYLPATSGGSRKITVADLDELNRGWAIHSNSRRAERLVPVAPWSGVKLKSAPGGQMVDSTGDLLAERDVGRGRIVVSAMQLAERELVNWKGGFESWFNSAVLRRPNRKYIPGQFDGVTLAWANPLLKESRLDARLTSGLRYMARDLGVDVNYRYVETPDENAQYYQQPPEVIREQRPPEHVGGVGAWNDFSATANAAREALLKAAGVEVPDTSFVVICLALYLTALVPLNWLVFNAIGRVEWAWIAAPLIAIAGTWAVVKQAQLDIGFVRAQTEIGLLELQPQYNRGHLARYTALYTSLSTTYDLEFDTMTAVAAPFPASENPDLRGTTQLVCDYERYDKTQLKGMFVSSNSTNMVHSEQMFALDAAVQLGKSSRGTEQIENRSQLYLRSVAIVRRPTLEEEAKGRTELMGSWIGDLRPGESAPAVFVPILVEADKAPFAKERAAEEQLQSVPRLDLEPTFRLALNRTHFEPGEKRLVARVDEVLAGQSITPAASQVRGATLVVAHLAYAPRPKPEPDLNTRQDIAADEPKQND